MTKNRDFDTSDINYLVVNNIYNISNFIPKKKIRTFTCANTRQFCKNIRKPHICVFLLVCACPLHELIFITKFAMKLTSQGKSGPLPSTKILLNNLDPRREINEASEANKS